MSVKHEPAWRRYLRFWGPDNSSDIEDEFQFHLQAKTDELVSQGLPPHEARRRAMQDFGPIHTVRKECYQISTGRQERASRMEYLAGWLRDFAYAFRMLRKTKASSVTAILILAVGIGANTAVFTLLDRLLYRPLPVPKSSQLLQVTDSVGYDGYIHLRDHNQVFSGFAAEAQWTPRERRGREKIDRPAEVHPVSGNFFEVLGVSAALGRVLAPSDDVRKGGSHVAVASDRFWSRRFNRSPNALGSAIYLNDVLFTIVGVASSRFSGVYKGSDPDLYVPLGALPDLFDRYNDPLSRCCSIKMFGRLRPGVLPQLAQSNLQTLWDPFRGKQHAGGSISVEDGSSGRAGTSGEKRNSLMLMAAIVAMLLLIGCANVACLLIARGAARRQEMAIRVSLGATKARIWRQSLLESLILAAVGGLAGLVLAFWAGRLLLIAFRWKELAIDLSPDWRVLAFTLGLSLATGLLFGLGPALQSLRSGRVALKHERTVSTFTSGKALVVAEVALSLVMVAGAAVFLRSFENLRSIPKGFLAADVSVIELATDEGVNGLVALEREAMRLAESLRGVPGVGSAAMADGVTFNGGAIGNTVTKADNPGEPGRSAFILRVDQNYFETLRMPLLSGRGFDANDGGAELKVVVLAESLAQRLFPNMNPLGRIIRVGEREGMRDELEIVGVVKDIKFLDVRDPAPDLLYEPIRQQHNTGAFHGTVRVHVRSRMNPSQLAAIVRDRIRQEHLPLSVNKASWLDDEIGATLLNDRIRMQASSLFGGLALLLITAGIYGLMAHSAVRRTREIGIRMAVGSSPAQIARLMLKESARLILIGVLLGVPGAIAVMKAVSGLVFGLPPIDGVSLAVAVVVLSITGIGASLGPAWRAAHLDPVNALRLE